jgi:hypothetical protein
MLAGVSQTPYHRRHLANIPITNILTDLTHWDVSHASDAQKAFFNATTFNQNIGSWDVPLPVIIRVGLIASSTKLPLAIKLVNKSEKGVRSLTHFTQLPQKLHYTA